MHIATNPQTNSVTRGERVRWDTGRMIGWTNTFELDESIMGVDAHRERGSELSRAEMPRAFKKDGIHCSTPKSTSINLSRQPRRSTPRLPVAAFHNPGTPAAVYPMLSFSTNHAHVLRATTRSGRRLLRAGLPCERVRVLSCGAELGPYVQNRQYTSLRYFFFPETPIKSSSNFVPRKNRTCLTLPGPSLLISSPL
jgi:hypothetical protein